MMQRDVVVTQNMTLDGVIDASDGWFAPAGGGDGVDRSDVESEITAEREPAGCRTG